MGNAGIGILLAFIFVGIIAFGYWWAVRDRERVVLDAPTAPDSFTKEELKNAMSRTLEVWEIDLLNKMKGFEAELLEFIEAQFSTGSCDDRWLAIARTDLQKGFMAFGRAIEKPGDATVPPAWNLTGKGERLLKNVDIVHNADGDVLAVKDPDNRKPSDIRNISPLTATEMIEEIEKDEEDVAGPVGVSLGLFESAELIEDEEPCLGAEVRRLGLTGEGEGNY